MLHASFNLTLYEFFLFFNLLFLLSIGFRFGGRFFFFSRFLSTRSFFNSSAVFRIWSGVLRISSFIFLIFFVFFRSVFFFVWFGSASWSIRFLFFFVLFMFFVFFRFFFVGSGSTSWFAFRWIIVSCFLQGLLL